MAVEFNDRRPQPPAQRKRTKSPRCCSKPKVETVGAGTYYETKECVNCGAPR